MSSEAAVHSARWHRPATWLALAFAVVAAALLGWHNAAPPQYCAEGLESRLDRETGARRCCGQAQRVERGRCVGKPTRCAEGMLVTDRGCVPQATVVAIAAGSLRVSPTDWEAASVVTPHEETIAAFGMDSHEVVQADYELCVRASACAPLPLTGEPGLPVTHATRSEAARFCAWRGGALPTSGQHAYAAMGAGGRRYPWGDTGAVCRRAAFGLAHGPCASGGQGPELAGSRPSGATPDAIQDLGGNVAEWTADRDPATDGLAPVRGGSWQDAAAYALRGWAQRWVPADTRAAAIGWRCAYPAR